MIDRLFDFSHTTVKEAMIPLIEIAAVKDTATVQEVIALIGTKGHSRVPVYRERIDNMVGVINSFDLLGNSSNEQALASLMRAVPFVPEVKPIDDLLIEMQKQGNHLAIVVDEYGGTVGIITIEDILEEIVGEIQDEYDRGQRLYRKTGKNKYVVNSRMEIDQIRELLSLTLAEGGYETLGGFLLEQFGHIPQPGEVFKYHNMTFTVLSSDERSIGNVRIQVKKH
jgi:CBS domain containing-hemolysin-like protein